MNDGRNYATYQPEAVINERIQEVNHINSNRSYRQFLTHNASSIMSFNTTDACYALGMSPYVKTDSTPSSNVPFIYTSTFDNRAPGYGYSNSDLKNPYLSRVELQARLVAPTMNAK